MRFFSKITLLISIVGLSACTKRLAPSEPVQLNQDEEQCSKKSTDGCGFLAFTIGFEAQTFFAMPKLEFTVLNKDTDKALTLVAPVNDLPEPIAGKRFSYKMFFFALPAGQYQIKNTQLFLPPTTKGGREYNELRIALTLDPKNELQTIEVKKRDIKHLYTSEISLVESSSGRMLYYNVKTNTFFRKPFRRPWKEVAKHIKDREVFFFKNKDNKKKWQAWKPNSPEKTSDDETQEN